MSSIYYGKLLDTNCPHTSNLYTNDSFNFFEQMYLESVFSDLTQKM